MMKQFYFSLFIVFFFHLSFGQIDFQGRIVKENINATPSVSSIKQVDMDNDGDLDLISVDGYDVKWFENVDGENSELVSHHIADSGGSYIDATDMDNDGDIDILFHTLTTLYYIENLGEDNFSTPQTLISTNDSNRPFYAFAIDDLDSDGDMDITYSYRADSWYSSLKWFENTDGQGTFVNNDIDEYARSKSTITADIDSDGDVDVLTFNYDNSEIEWFVNDGSQSFTKQTVTSAQFNGYATLNVADIDGDNDLDLIVTDSEGFSNSLEEVKILKNDGSGGFTEFQSSLSSVLDFSFITINDMDGDGDLDLAFSSFTDHTIGWFENLDGNGTFGTDEILSNKAERAKCVISYDFDDDGDIDILSASQSDDKIAVYENLSGTGDFENEQIITSSINNPNKIITADIDGDGDLDVIASSRSDAKLTWYENLDGNGDFGPQRIVGSGILSIEAFAANDLDGDGDIDIVSGNSNSSSSPFFWFENLDGQGNFSRSISLGWTSGLNNVVSIDMDYDGDNDIVYNVGWSADGITWLENVDGQGDFSQTNQITTSIGNGNKLEFKDINNDGFIDLILQGQSDYGWYANDGSGNFTESIIDTNLYDPLSFTVFDFDTDGDLDIICAYEAGITGPNRLGWLENLDGQGNFEAMQTLDSNIPGFPSTYEIELYSGDLNNDGYIDILTRGYDRAGWYENSDAAGTLLPLNMFFEDNLRVEDIHITDLNADGKTDFLSTYSISPYGGDFMDDKILWYKNIGLGSNEISGVVKSDVLLNGCGASSQPLHNVMVVANSDSQSLATFTLSNGFYQLFPNLGTYSTSVASSIGSYYTADPSSYNFTFTESEITETANFCAVPLATINEMAINIIPTSEARPGFDATYQIIYRNTGTNPLSGTITYQFDGDKLNYLNSSESPAAQTTNALTFNFNNLLPLETNTIDVAFNLLPPPTVNIDDVLAHTVTINPDAGDQHVFVLNQTVIGSYDPNDITCLEGEHILLEDVDKYLHYVIRFQNTGNASAINVRVENVLDDKLDYTTMQLESLSHEGRVEIVNGSDVSFIFDNINLPDSTNDEPNSHGFIAYKIRPKDNVVLGDIFSNSADIYFDFNPAIITNTVATEIVDALSVNEYESNLFSVHPNPVTSELTINGSIGIEVLSIIDINGRLLKQFSKLNQVQNITIDVSNLNSGLYFLNIQSGNKQQTIKFIKD